MASGGEASESLSAQDDVVTRDNDGEQDEKKEEKDDDDEKDSDNNESSKKPENDNGNNSSSNDDDEDDASKTPNEPKNEVPTTEEVVTANATTVSGATPHDSAKEEEEEEEEESCKKTDDADGALNQSDNLVESADSMESIELQPTDEMNANESLKKEVKEKDDESNESLKKEEEGTNDDMNANEPLKKEENKKGDKLNINGSLKKDDEEKNTDETNAKESVKKEEDENNKNDDSSVSSSSSSSDDEDDDDDDEDAENKDPENQLSQYELLRLRNIERNNARLAQLGLNKIDIRPKKTTPPPPPPRATPSTNVQHSHLSNTITPTRIMPKRTTRATKFFGDYDDSIDRRRRSGGGGGMMVESAVNCCFICYKEDEKDLLSCDYCRKKFHRHCHTLPNLPPVPPSEPSKHSDPSHPPGTPGTSKPSGTSEPSKPSDPTEPTGTSGPSKPSGTSEPAGASKPSDPTDPTGPAGTPEPSKPSDSTEPAGTSESSKPSDPTEPAETSKPSDPTDPTGPAGTSKLSDQTDPTEPAGTSKPSDPTDPTGPADTSKPSDPTDPTGPADTSKPSDPTDPTEPVETSKPSSPSGTTQETLEFRIKCMVCAGARRQRRGRCNECEECTRENCGSCIYCLDMPRYGGPARLRKSCIMRTCSRPVYTIASMEKGFGGVASPPPLMCLRTSGSGDDSAALEDTKMKLERNFEGDKHTNSDNCVVCNDGGCLICCDGCDRAYHLLCHIPKLFSLPTGEWKCMKCLPRDEMKKKRRNKRLIAKINRKEVWCRVIMPVAFCSVCFEDADSDKKTDEFVYCKYCDESFHLSCLSPPMESKPRGTFKCSKCREQNQSAPRRPATSKRPVVKLFPKDETITNDDSCYICINGGELLCCDFCDKSFHLECHIPPIVEIPPGRWKCMECSAVERRKRSRCGECKACLSPDCGKCAFCLDKPKFGGNYTLKKPCKMRECENLNYAAMIPMSIACRKSKVSNRKVNGKQKQNIQKSTQNKEHESIKKEDGENGQKGDHSATKKGTVENDKKDAILAGQSSLPESKEVKEENSSSTKKDDGNKLNGKAASETDKHSTSSLLSPPPTSEGKRKPGRPRKSTSPKKHENKKVDKKASTETNNGSLTSLPSTPSTSEGKRKPGRSRKSISPKKDETKKVNGKVSSKKEDQSLTSPSSTPSAVEGKRKPGRPRKSISPVKDENKKVNGKVSSKKGDQSLTSPSSTPSTVEGKRQRKLRSSLKDDNGEANGKVPMSPPSAAEGKRRPGRPRKSQSSTKDETNEANEKVSSQKGDHPSTSPSSPPSAVEGRRPGRPRRSQISVKDDSNEATEKVSSETNSHPLISPSSPSSAVEGKRRQSRLQKSPLSRSSDKYTETKDESSLSLSQTPSTASTKRKRGRPHRILSSKVLEVEFPTANEPKSEPEDLGSSETKDQSSPTSVTGEKRKRRRQCRSQLSSENQNEEGSQTETNNSNSLKANGSITSNDSLPDETISNSPSPPAQTTTPSKRKRGRPPKVRLSSAPLEDTNDEPSCQNTSLEDDKISERANKRRKVAPILPSDDPTTVKIKKIINDAYAKFWIPKVQDKAIERLRKMMTTDEAATKIIELGGITLATKAMKSFPDKTIVQAEACALFAQIIWIDPTYASKIVSEDGIDLMISAMNRLPFNSKVQQMGCGAFRALTYGDNNRKLIEKVNGTHVVLSSMMGNPHKAMVQKEGCYFLQNMLILSDNTSKEVINAGVVPVVAGMMANNPADIDIQDAICGFFSNLATIDESSKESIIDAGAIPLLIAALRDCDHLDVKQVSCSALRHLSSNQHSCSKIIKEYGAIEWAMTAMKSYSNDPMFLVAACGLLKELALYDEKNAETITHDGGVGLVVSAMDDNLSSAELQEAACAFLALDCVRCAKKQAVEATRIILLAIDKHRDEVYVQVEVCRALLRLSQLPPVMKMLNEDCAWKQLSVLKDDYPEACGSLIDKLRERIFS